MPGISLIIGSLIGCGAAVLYNISKKPLISLAQVSGFTCFGLVDQDYALPEEALKDLGINLAKIEVANISRAQIEYAQVKRSNVNDIQIKMVRRGVFSINKIGYTYG